MSSVTLNVLVGFCVCLFVSVAVVVAVKRKKAIDVIESSYILRVISRAMLALALLHTTLIYWLINEANLFVGGSYLVLSLYFTYLSHRAVAGEKDPESVYSAIPLSQKFAILFVIITTVVFPKYFSDTWGLSLVESLPVFIGAVILTIVLSVVGSIVITLSHGPISQLEEEIEYPDERDKQVDILAIRNAYYIISPALVLLMLGLITGLETAKVVQLGLAVLVLTEVVKYSSQIFYYHFGE